MDFKETRRLRGHVGAVLCARFTKDGAYALTAGADRSVKLWNPARGHPDTGALLIKNYVGPHAKEISQICVADDCSRFASVGGDTQDDALKCEADHVTAHMPRRNRVVDKQPIKRAAVDAGCLCEGERHRWLQIAKRHQVENHVCPE